MFGLTASFCNMKRAIEIRVFKGVASLSQQDGHAWLATSKGTYARKTHTLRIKTSCCGLVAVLPQLPHSDSMPTDLRHFTSGLKRIVAVAGDAHGLQFKEKEDWGRAPSQGEEPLPGLSYSAHQMWDLKQNALQKQVCVLEPAD